MGPTLYLLRVSFIAISLQTNLTRFVLVFMSGTARDTDHSAALDYS